MIRFLLSVLFFASIGFLVFKALNTNKQSDLIRIVVTDAEGREEKATFMVEIAKDMISRAKGLMFREKLAESGGMIFVFPQEAEHTFWMKNTLIPLDMIFIGQDEKVAGIVEAAQPGNLGPLGAGIKNLYVLEINAGLTKKYGINKGDLVKGLEDL